MSVKGSGVYAIRHIASGRMYVGSARRIEYRWWQHQSRLRAGTHHSPKLQNAWNKYGPDSFEWLVLELVNSVHELIAVEQRWIDQAAAYGRGFNMRALAASSLGMKQRPEVIAKRSRILSGRKLSPEHKAKIAQGVSGRVLSPASREKISAALTGVKRAPMSAETRAKMSAARKGVKKGPMSAEQRKKLSAAHKGKKRGPLSDETRRRISEAKLAARRSAP